MKSKEAFERAGQDVVRRGRVRGQGEGGDVHEAAAGAILHEFDVRGDGVGKGLGGALHGVQQVDEPVAIGLHGGDVIGGVAQGRLVVVDLVAASTVAWRRTSVRFSKW